MEILKEKAMTTTTAIPPDTITTTPEFRCQLRTPLTRISCLVMVTYRETPAFFIGSIIT